MSDDESEWYGRNFYSQYAAGSSRPAAIILERLFKLYRPQSVIDVGCGQGAWLSAAESCGATALTGLDGDWVNETDLLSKNIRFVPVNLSESFPTLNERFDLCISVEVAEHLPEQKAAAFVDLLCRASDTILFGAAIKHQGGTNHINEQWPSYWINLFKSRGYACIDCIRGAVWDNPAVAWWYRQNTFLFIGPNHPTLKKEELRALERPLVDVVHPMNYEGTIRDYETLILRPTFRFCLGCMRRWLNNRFHRLIGRRA